MVRKAKAPSVADFALVCDGAAGTVRLGPEVMREYGSILNGTDKLSVQRRVHLQRYFEAFCKNGDFYRQLGEEKFKKEGSFSDGIGGVVAIFAFKVWQWRLYGAVLGIDGKRCFVGVRLDTAKKQDKANQDLLKRAAKDIGMLSDYRPREGV